MGEQVRAFLALGLVEAAALRGGVAIVIDQLRATSTIAYALAAGAAAIVACEEVDEARRRAKALPGSLLGGEREGVKIEGFDLGNSPSEYTRERVAGKTIVFTTTNGTRALARAAGAERIFLGALVNRVAVATAAAAGRPVALICAGIRGQVSAEDVLAAGAIAAGLRDLGLSIEDDAARLAVDAWERVAGDRDGLLAALHASRGGRNLASVGLSADVEWCARVDSLDIVPVVDSGGRVVRM